MITDLHTHLWDSPDQLGNSAAKWIRTHAPEPWLRPEPSPQSFNEAMLPTSHAVILGLQSLHLHAHISIEQIASYIALNPQKYLGFAGLDPIDPNCLKNIDLAIEHNLVGLTVSPSASAFHPTHSAAMALYEKAQSLKLPILFQTATHLGPQAALEFDQPLLLDEVARTFPDLKIVIPQIGHPFSDQTLTLLSKHENIYADLSDLTRKPWQLYHNLLKAHEQNATDKLLLGSDYPFFTPEKAILAIYSINTLAQHAQLPTVPREMLRAIVERNTLACLNITAPQQSTPQPQPTSQPINTDSEFPTIIINDQEN